MKHAAFNTIGALYLAACTAPPPTASFSPFADRPDEGYTFAHELRVIDGPVWLFEADGAPVTHGGPVGLMTDSNTYVVKVTPVIFDLPDMRSVVNTSPAEIRALVAATDRFCDESGYLQTGRGAAIHTNADATFLVRHCLPPGITIPRDGKAGDDVQRNPLLRAFGVAPLRGRDFSNRRNR